MAGVPLASIQDEWSEFVDFKTTNDDRPGKRELASRSDSFQNKSSKRNSNLNSQVNCDKLGRSKDKQFSGSLSESPGFNGLSPRHADEQTDEEVEEEEFRAFKQQFEQIKQQGDLDGEPKIKVESLEELVKTFDEKIVNCFVNYEEPVESFAPVQVLNPEELIGECE